MGRGRISSIVPDLRITVFMHAGRDQANQPRVSGVLMLSAMTILLGIAYLAAGRWCLQRADAARRFAWLNIAALSAMLFLSTPLVHNPRGVAYILLLTSLYVAAMRGHYKLLQKGQANPRYYRLAFWAPIGVLVAVKLLTIAKAAGIPAAVWIQYRLVLIGVSYLSFKLSYSALELRHGKTRLPSWYGYLGYALYAPTLLVGPINSLATQKDTALPMPETRKDAYPHLRRILIGLFKVGFLACMFERVGVEALIVKGAVPADMDYVVALFANFFFLYFNFSGACDVVIAFSGLLGIYVKENFNNPIMARSVQDFWSRWHMTLSHYFRDVMFTPMNTWLVSIFGPRHVNHCIAITIMAVFLLIGLWHGTGWNFILLGAIHGFAVIVNHYWALGMKSFLGKRYKAFHTHPLVTGFSIAVTFCFICITLLLVTLDIPAFINYLENLNRILKGTL